MVIVAYLETWLVHAYVSSTFKASAIFTVEYPYKLQIFQIHNRQLLQLNTTVAKAFAEGLTSISILMNFLNISNRVFKF